MDQEEDNDQVLRVLSFLKKLRMLVNKVADLRVRAELRLIDDALDWHIDICLPKSDLFRGCNAYKLAVRAESDWITALRVKYTLLIAPLVELHILFFLFNLMRPLPIDLKFLSIS